MGRHKKSIIYSKPMEIQIDLLVKLQNQETDLIIERTQQHERVRDERTKLYNISQQVSKIEKDKNKIIKKISELWQK